MPETITLREVDMGLDPALATKTLRRMCEAVSDTALECTGRESLLNPNHRASCCLEWR